VRASGLTAVNLTVNGSPGNYARDCDETIRQIAYWNEEIVAHPNVFLDGQYEYEQTNLLLR
jgi:membrane dipeptidase